MKYVYVYTCIHICVMPAYACRHVRVCVCGYAYACMCMCVHVCICVVCIHVYVHVCVYKTNHADIHVLSMPGWVNVYMQVDVNAHVHA